MFELEVSQPYDRRDFSALSVRKELAETKGKGIRTHGVLVDGDVCFPQFTVSKRVIDGDTFTFREGRKTKCTWLRFAVESFRVLAESDKGVESGLVAAL